MFFIASKLLSFILKPLSWIILCFVASLFWKRVEIKKFFFRAGVVLLIIFTNPWISETTMHWWETDPILISSLKTHDVAIVLSGVTNDYYPHDRVHYNKGADRVLHTIQLYKAGKIDHILISGGSGLVMNTNHDVESENLRKTMLLAGVPDSVITLETKSRNTHENAQNSARILTQKFSGQKFLLVTSAFHMKRAIGCFEKEGLKVKAFPVDFYTTEEPFEIDALVPSIEALQLWQILFKEWFGIIVYKITGYI